jgi:hypothetical protein
VLLSLLLTCCSLLHTQFLPENKAKILLCFAALFSLGPEINTNFALFYYSIMVLTWPGSLFDLTLWAILP